LSKQADFCGFGMKAIHQKREIRSKGLVDPQIAPKNLGADIGAPASQPSTWRGGPQPFNEDGEV
jgi:hypothetical protein